MVLDEADEMLKKDFYEQIKPSDLKHASEWLSHRAERG